MYSLDEVKNVDPEVAQAIVDEQERQNSHIELIASENWVSRAVMAAMGSPLTNKYAEGYPGKRYYGGCGCVDVVEELARERAKELFGCEYANVQPHSGAQANMAVQFAVCQPGDTIMGMNLDHGGHLTHGSPVNMSGKYFKIVPYGVNDEGFIDYDRLREIALEAKPRMIIAGASLRKKEAKDLYYSFPPQAVFQREYLLNLLPPKNVAQSLYHKIPLSPHKNPVCQWSLPPCVHPLCIMLPCKNQADTLGQYAYSHSPPIYSHAHNILLLIELYKFYLLSTQQDKDSCGHKAIPHPLPLTYRFPKPS